MAATLGPRLARKPLHLFWILDTSGSMGVAGKIGALNTALRDAVPALREAVADNPGVELLVRVVTFDHDARWHVGEPVPIEQFEWNDVAVTEDGTTELGRAIDLVTHQIRAVAAARRGMPPALVLVSDGKPTDLKQPTFGASLRTLMEEPWGQKASRMAIGIGADADMEALGRFIGHDEIKPIRASNASELAHYLRWASTVVVGEVSRIGGTGDEAAADGTRRTTRMSRADGPPRKPPAPGPRPEAEPAPRPMERTDLPTDAPPVGNERSAPDAATPPPLPPPEPPPTPPPPPPRPAEVDDDITW